MKPRAVDIRLRADIREIEALVAAVDAFASAHGVSEDALFRLQLSLDELVNNIINYGYPGTGPGQIAIRLTHMGDRIGVEMSDDAVLFDPSVVPVPDVTAGIDERRLGGLGVHIVRNLVDEVSYRVRDGQNHLRLILNLAPAADGNRRS